MMKHIIEMKYVITLLNSELLTKQNERSEIKYIADLATIKDRKDYLRLTSQIIEIKEAINRITLNY